MTVVSIPKRGDLVCVTSPSTGLSGLFLVMSSDAVKGTVQVVYVTMDLAAVEADWPKEVALTDVDTLIACSEAGF